jgi:hypothetical protein
MRSSRATRHSSYDLQGENAFNTNGGKHETKRFLSRNLTNVTKTSNNGVRDL